MKKFKALIMSDLHASKVENDDSYLVLNDDKFWVKSFIKYAKTVASDIDAIICAGDISNKGCSESLHSGWEFINELSEELNNKKILCVPGNHDHQSRKYELSPMHEIKHRLANFPASCFNKNTHFWAWNWMHEEEDSYNCILINTSAYHGYGDTEYIHGRVSIETVDQIFDYIKKSESFNREKLNILLCHHHPQKMDFVDHSYDNESMIGGDYLLSKLQDTDVGQWLVIHGHKHFSNISYGASSSSQKPIIISSASLSAKLYNLIQSRTSNQFYILEVHMDSLIADEKIRGTINCHEWNYTNGWHPSKSTHTPAVSGFGEDLDFSKVRKILRAAFENQQHYITVSESSELEEMIKYLVPKDIEKLTRKLKEDGYEVIMKDHSIEQIGALKK
ncbi:metallophosphoesterase [Shewanella algae]|uniref:metallophosphoesterase family protein n=1 Tax=Shewanella algae TaxID=38313 RepID=UPI002936D325|nr:metallophosphoesterase [Shewanella algae]MDV2962076.1 metallophosphoesterase [Shewanella algae]